MARHDGSQQVTVRREITETGTAQLIVNGKPFQSHNRRLKLMDERLGTELIAAHNVKSEGLMDAIQKQFPVNA